MGVTQTAAPASRHHQRLAGAYKVGLRGLGCRARYRVLVHYLDESARRHVNIDVGRCLAVLLVGRPRTAVLCLEVLLVVEGKEGVQVGIDAQVDAAAAPAVAPVRPALRYKL